MVQEAFCKVLIRRLERRGLTPRTVGISDFGNRAPLMTVKRVMTRCSGALILGLSQLVIGLGVRKPGTSGEGAIQNIRLPTAWNHLEAGMAFALGLPLLIVRESNVSPEGIFDPSVADYFVHHGDMTPNWLDSEAFRQPFDEWIADVVKYAGN